MTRSASVFRNHDYLILLTGQTISGTGASMGIRFVFPLAHDKHAGQRHGLVLTCTSLLTGC